MTATTTDSSRVEIVKKFSNDNILKSWLELWIKEPYMNEYC